VVAYADEAAYELTAPGPGGLVLALHGLTGTRWQPLEYLSGGGVDVGGSVGSGLGVLAPDLPGHGGSPAADDGGGFSAVGVAADVVELVALLGLASMPVHVVGVSLGAVVALEVTLNGRLDVRSAAFVRPAHTDRPGPDHLRGNLLVADLLDDDPADAVRRLLDTPEYRAVAARSPSAAANLRSKAAGPPGSAALLRAGSGWTAYERLGLLPPEVATLVIAADGDPLHPVEVAKEWAARLPVSAAVRVGSEVDPARPGGAPPYGRAPTTAPQLRTVPSRDAGPAHVAAVAAALRGFLGAAASRAEATP
jgi:pimeloyl-ACP methyl ester carboxylesterase